MKKKFGFFLHPRNINDILSAYSFLRLFPKKIILKIIIFLPPKCMGSGSIILNNKRVEGYFICVFLTAEQMLMLPRKAVHKKIERAIRLAVKLNVGIIGLGGMTSPVTNGGLDFINKFKLGLTTGNAYTVATSIIGINNILNNLKLNIKDLKVCVIGATGSVGQGLSKKISFLCNNLLLIGRTYKHLLNLKEEILRYNNSLNIDVSLDISSICDCDIVIIATSSTEVIIDPSILKNKAIVYDVSQPKNISPNLSRVRKDILVIDGGLVKVNNFKTNINLFLPPLTIYGCLAETILLAAENHFDNFAIGKVNIEQINKIETIGLKYCFEPNNVKI